MDKQITIEIISLHLFVYISYFILEIHLLWLGTYILGHCYSTIQSSLVI